MTRSDLFLQRKHELSLKTSEADPSLPLYLLLRHYPHFHRPEYFSLMNLESSFSYFSYLKTLLVTGEPRKEPFVFLQLVLRSYG